MKKTMKKIIATILTAAMVMSVGMPAFADTDNGIAPYAHDVEVKRELVDTDYHWEYGILVSGQPAGGTRADGGSLFCIPSEGPTLTVSIAFVFKTLSVDISSGNFTGTSGVGVGAPTIYGKYCHLYLDKQIACDKYATYERLIGTSNWNLVGYDYVTRDHQVRAYCKAV